MAQLEKLIPLIFKWEGSFVNDPADLGGPTNSGVTLKTWKAQGYDKDGDGIIDMNDLKLITRNDVVNLILRPHYWNRWQADRIQNQSIANILVDWVWGSGVYGIKIPQVILKEKVDGIVGEKTLAALNHYPDQKMLFERIKAERIAYIERICLSRPANRRFKKGWLNRLADFRFFLMASLLALTLCWGGCKSVSAEKNLHAQSEQGERIENDMAASTDRQGGRSMSFHSFTESEENSVSQTKITQYDTSLPPDTITGAYPVRSIVETVTVKGFKMNRTDTARQVSAVRELSQQADKSKTVVRNKEEIRLRQSVKDPYRWRYLAMAIIGALAGCYFLFRKH